MKSNRNHTRIFFLLSLCCMLMLPACQQRRARVLMGKTLDMQNLMLTNLAGGSYCGIDNNMEIVIKSDEEWKYLWERVHRKMVPEPPLPEVDFSAETVLAVFMGTRSTGGYSIEISHLTMNNGKITAIVKTRSPQPGDMVTMALSQPYHIIKINITDQEFEFIRE